MSFDGRPNGRIDMIRNVTFIPHRSSSKKNSPMLIRSGILPSQTEDTSFVNTFDGSKTETTFILRLTNFMPRKSSHLSFLDITRPNEIPSPSINISEKRSRPLINVKVVKQHVVHNAFNKFSSTRHGKQRCFPGI
jgi:hypothetical protein